MNLCITFEASSDLQLYVAHLHVVYHVHKTFSIFANIMTLTFDLSSLVT